MLRLFQATLFVSSALLFLVQPLAAKSLLPLFGGTPAVWTSCMLFFQGALLAGYLLAHLAAKRLPIQTHVIVQIAVLALVGAIALPFGVPHADSIERMPALAALWALAASVGLPYLAVSMMNPVLQHWFARSAATQSQDPYFLYAASNAGSFMGLLSYPLLLEPTLGLPAQRLVWTAGYLILLVGILACGLAVYRRPLQAASSEVESTPVRVDASQRIRWTVLAMIPSSLLLATTQHLTNDLAPVPLLWVVPLSLYLLTFVVVFARRPSIPHEVVVRWFLPAATCLAGATAFQGVWVIGAMHLAAFTLAALLCHGELAADRPPPAALTDFYLWTSFGGVLGGVINSLVAPVVFPTTLELPLAWFAAAVVGWKAMERRGLRVPASGLVAVVAAVAAIAATHPFKRVEPLIYAAAIGTPLAFYGLWRGRIWLTPIGLGVVLIVDDLWTEFPTVLVARSFFGAHRVVRSGAGMFHSLMHGGTVHGIQRIGGSGDPCEPLTYYHPSGPLGDFFNTIGQGKSNVGLVGLGTGAAAAYCRPGQKFTFFEIDPVVVSIAKDPRYFRYLTRCAGGKVEVVLGDGRRRLAERKPGEFDLLMFDAFTSDAIPMHLLTTEAIKGYETRLSPAGAMAFHISSRFLDLGPVLASAAGRLGLQAWSRDDLELEETQINRGLSPSRYVVLVRTEANLCGLDRVRGWRRLSDPGPDVAWTDDRSNLLRNLNFNTASPENSSPPGN